jgi:hypothetical protein
MGLDQHGQAMPVVGLADLGDGKTPRGALDQAHAQALFEQGDAAAQLGFGQVERPAGRRETLVLDHLHKVIKIVEVLHGFIVPQIER